MLRVQSRRGHRRLEIKAEPLLNAAHSRALRQVEEQHEIKHDRGGQNGIAAEEVHLDLHRIAEPSKNVDAIPALFVVTARRVVIDAYLVAHIAVERSVKVRCDGMTQNGALRAFLAFV